MQVWEEMVDQEGIWNGELKEGAIMQVYDSEEEFNTVVEGNNSGAYGHSFIFLSYEYDADGNITGMNIVDQGYLNNSTVTQERFGVWFGANITVSKTRDEVIPISLPSNGIQSVI
ncbi:hypothetical protein TPENAI_60287 [Tenacibaculum litopenaei]